MKLEILDVAKRPRRRQLTTESMSLLVTEFFRQEMSAWGVCLRRVLLAKVAERFADAVDAEPPNLPELCEELVRAGDLLEGDNGWIAAGPVRLVPLSKNSWRLAGAIPTSRVEELGVVTASAGGIIRVLEGLSAPGASQALLEAGGREISPESWAGLDMAPAAGAGALEEFLAAPDAVCRDALGTHPDYPQPWRIYLPEPGKVQARRWTVPNRLPVPSLWRTFNCWRKPVFAWTSGLSPADGPWRQLGAEQALRLQFSLDRTSGAPLPVAVEKRKKTVALEIEGFLPRPEFRYLQVMGIWERPSGERKAHRFEFATDTWPPVRKMLDERLGIGTGDGA